MYFSKHLKLFISFADINSEDDLYLVDSNNTYNISELSSFTEQVLVAPYVFADSARQMDDSVNRGVHTSPGAQTGYTLTFTTYLALPALGVVNNTALWDALLTGRQSDSKASDSGSITNKSNHSQLVNVSIIAVNKDTVQVYTNCVGNSLGLDLNISTLCNTVWTFEAGQSFTTTRISESGNRLYVDGVAKSLPPETNLEYIANKLVLCNISSESDQTSLDIAVTQAAISFTNSVERVTNTVIDAVGQTTSYKPGSFSISGGISAYYRDTTGQLLNHLKSEYSSNSLASNKNIVFILKGATRSLRLTIGACFIPPATVDTTTIYTVNFGFTANNYYHNDLTLERI